MYIAKEQLRQIISKNGINVLYTYKLFENSFKDMLQELLEEEMDAVIVYTKNNKKYIISENKRNGYSKKTVKSQYGEF